MYAAVVASGDDLQFSGKHESAINLRLSTGIFFTFYAHIKVQLTCFVAVCNYVCVLVIQLKP